MTKYSFPVALGLAAAVLWSAAAQAANEKHYGVVCLRNDTRANITYERKVGRSGWEARFMAPGEVWRMAHKYDSANENESPKVLVRYDSDARSGKFTQNKELMRRAAVGDSCQEGYIYAFRYEAANRNFITLDRAR